MGWTEIGVRRAVLTVGSLGLALLAAVPGAGAVVGQPSDGAVQIHPATLRVGQVTASVPTTAACEAVIRLRCYGPTQIERAYNLPALYARGITGRGQTIVIVDSFGSPTIAHDLGVFDATYHLPAPPSLKVISPVGKIPPYVKNSEREGWAGETTLDVEYAHTIAPGASILLVETPTAETEGTTGFPAIVAAEKYVIDHGLGSVISQSFDATEETFPSEAALLRLRSAYVDAARHHVTVLAASGDSGAANYTNGSGFYPQPTVDWPASDPLVTAVGGTQLSLDAAGHHKSADAIWNDTSSKAVQQTFGRPGHVDPFATGGGTSVVFGRPAYQDGVAAVVGSQRGIPDISMSASCSAAVNVYESFPGYGTGWSQSCGTSESSPMFAGIVALADQVAHRHLGPVNARIYALAAAAAPGIVDVSGGDNSVSFTAGHTMQTVTGFPAAVGYDLSTGVGTVNAAVFVPELAGKSS